MSDFKFATREAWLEKAVECFRPTFSEVGSPLPEKVRVTCGWPSSRGTSKKRRAIGECWDATAADDKVAQVFISPVLAHPWDGPESKGFGVLPVLAHELGHAALGNEEGHGKGFRRLMKGLLLEGKATSTFAGEAFIQKHGHLLETLGDYPHAKLNPAGKGAPKGSKKQGTRMVKCECEECGYMARVTRKWLQVGAPSCPEHGAMKFDEKVLDGYEADESDE